jgi:uncharacterized membrane protein YfcA
VAVIAGAIASVTGFGVGSLLTPLVGLFVDIRVSVAVVSIPHFLGMALRYWVLHKHVDWRVLRSFGLTSAAGGSTVSDLIPLLTASMSNVDIMRAEVH